MFRVQNGRFTHPNYVTIPQQMKLWEDMMICFLFKTDAVKLVDKLVLFVGSL